MERTSETRRGTTILVHVFLFSFLRVFLGGHGRDTDIFCLKSIKDSLEDPLGYISSSRNFNNKTEGCISRFNGVQCWHPDENRVLNLKLSNMGLKGQFPRGVQNCTSLTGLDLSINELSGPIPSDVSVIFAFATSIDLSNNKFSGEIPPALGNCTYLNALKLDNNMLSGHIPAELAQLGRIRSISLANNKLSGQVPAFGNGLATVDSYANNRGLCGGPLAPCSSDKGLLRQSFNDGLTIALLMERLTSTMRFDELSEATECFSIDNAIGVGKMGIMYNGTRANGWHLAVERISDSQLFERQVLIEIRILGKLRHRNIVPLLGFCVENKERILVYQYTSNGRLSKWLHPMESEVTRLTWPDRIKIALGVARALSWLHHTCNLHIVHLNISSQCILLDNSFEPKISNFGEAKFMNPNSQDVLGMAFYVHDGKKDVYDFGSVLLELVTRKTLNELLCSSNTANLSSNRSVIYDAIDKSLIGKGFENEVLSLIKVACECIQPIPDQRPTMLQVYNNMRNIWEGRHGLGVNDDSDTPSRSEIVSATNGDEIVEL